MKDFGEKWTNKSEQPRVNIPRCLLSKLWTQVAFSLSVRVCLRTIYASGELSSTQPVTVWGPRGTVLFREAVWMTEARDSFGIVSRVCYARRPSLNPDLGPNIYLSGKKDVPTKKPKSMSLHTIPKHADPKHFHPSPSVSSLASTRSDLVCSSVLERAANGLLGLDAVVPVLRTVNRSEHIFDSRSLSLCRQWGMEARGRTQHN